MRAVDRMRFDPEALAAMLFASCPRVDFAFLHGSARDGLVRPGGDIDVAVHVRGRETLALHGAIGACVERAAPGVPCDVSVINHANPVLQFEALKGRRLFVRDAATYAAFFSRACRAYERQMVHYERQRRYRREALRRRKQPTAD